MRKVKLAHILAIFSVLLLGPGSFAPEAAGEDGCAGACDPWYWQPDPGYCGGTHRWQRLCFRGGEGVWQQTCSATHPGNCSEAQSFLPAAGCAGTCDPWYWQPDRLGCSSNRWVRLCHASGVQVWEESCSPSAPSRCTGERGCYCEWGADFNGDPIDPAATFCSYRVCGADNGYYECNASGWSFLGGQCPQPGDQPTDQCEPATGAVEPFPAATLAVRGINYFPGEHYQGRMWANWEYDLIRADLDLAQSLSIDTLRVILNRDVLMAGQSYRADARGKVDRLLCEARRRGMRVAFLFEMGSKDFPCSRGMTADEQAFVREVVSAYRDDPTVILWEIANEPHCGNISPPYVPWQELHPDVQDRLVDGIAYLKSYDSNHSVTFALLQDQIDDVGPALLNAIDVFSFHLWDASPRSFDGGTTSVYPVNYLEAGANAAGGKPLFLGEFGCVAHEWIPGFGYDSPRYCDPATTGAPLSHYETKQADFFDTIYQAAQTYGYAGVAPWQFSEAEEQDPVDGSQNIENAAFPFFGFVRLDHTLRPAAVRMGNAYFQP